MKTSSFISITAIASLVLVSCGNDKGNLQLNEDKDKDVYRLIGLLDNEDVDVARSAARSLGALKREEAVPALIRTMNNKDIGLSLAARGALTRIGPAAAALIVKEDTETIEKAIMVLHEIGEPAVPFVLDELKKTKNVHRQLQLFLVLSFMGKKAAAAIPYLEGLKESGQNPSTVVVIESTIMRLKYGDQAHEMMESELEKRRTVLDKKGEELQKEASSLANDIGNPTIDITSPAADELMPTLGDDPKRALSKLLPMLDGTPQSRATAFICMGRFCEKNPASKPSMLLHLRKGLKDEETTIQALSAIVMVKVGETMEGASQAIAVLGKTFDPLEIRFAIGAILESKAVVQDKDALEKLSDLLALYENDPETAAFSALILVNSGVQDELLIPVVIKMLESDDIKTRTGAIAVILKMGSLAKPAAAAIKAAYRRETEPELKSSLDIAILAMGKTEDDHESILSRFDRTERTTWVIAALDMERLDSAGKRAVVKPLLSRWKAANEDKKRTILHTICKFGADAEEAFPFLKAVLENGIKNGDSDIMFLVTDAMGKIGKPEAAPLIIDVLKTRDRKGVLAATVALQKMGQKANGVIPDILKMVEDPRMREESLSLLAALGPLQTEEQGEIMVKLMEGNTDVAFTVMFTLEKANSTKAVNPLLRRLNSQEKLTRKLVIACLGTLGRGDPRVKSALQAALASERDEHTIKELEEALRKLELTAADDEREHIDSLLKRLSDPDLQARRLAILVLGDLGKKDQRVIPALKKALTTEKDEQTIDEIRISLERLEK